MNFVLFLKKSKNMNCYGLCKSSSGLDIYLFSLDVISVKWMERIQLIWSQIIN